MCTYERKKTWEEEGETVTPCPPDTSVLKVTLSPIGLPEKESRVASV